MAYIYDSENIFAKILRDEIPCNKIYETDHSLAFYDITPQAPIHILVIPKGAYVSFDHFALKASPAEITDYVQTIGVICRKENITTDKNDGFRLIANAGKNGIQEVPHLHVHILAGKSLGKMLTQ